MKFTYYYILASNITYLPNVHENTATQQ